MRHLRAICLAVTLAVALPTFFLTDGFATQAGENGALLIRGLFALALGAFAGYLTRTALLTMQDSRARRVERNAGRR